MAVQVCETVTAATMAELRTRRDGARRADLVEIRLDGVRDVDVAGALAGRGKPVVITCRPAREGGRFDGSEPERLTLLAEAVRQGAEYVDVEWSADRTALPSNEHTRLVVSHHDLHGTPSDLADRVRAMRSSGAHIVKIAVTANRLRDCLTLRNAVRDAGEHVAIAMGSRGQLSRTWPAGFGSCWTYAGAAAPGQIPTAALLDTYRVHDVTAASEVYGLTGAPLAHSASPAMHNAAFAELGLDAVYVPLETDDADEFLEVAGAIALSGASVTAPLKNAAAARVRVEDPDTERMGAVNTVRRQAREWTGRNFDAAAFLAPLDTRGLRLAGRHAVVAGAGGAARAVVQALVSRGASVEVAARRPERALALATAFQVAATSWPPASGWDLFVNATPAGTWPDVDRAPIDGRTLAGAPGRLVYDLVYNPAETTLMRRAREAGAGVIGGLEMLVAQACAQFEWWTGRPAPRDAMAAAARAAVAPHRTAPTRP